MKNALTSFRALALCLLALIAASPAFAISVGYTSYGLATTGSVSTTAGSAGATGSTFIAVVADKNATTGVLPTSVIDSNSVSYTLAKNIIYAPNQGMVGIYYCINCAGGASYSVTATFPGSQVNISIGVTEFTGVGAGTLDATPTGTQAFTAGGTAFNAPTLSTTVANELVVSCFALISTATLTITDSGSGFAIAISQPGPSGLGGAISYAIPASSGTTSGDTYTFTGNNDNYGALTISIKPNATVLTGVVISNGHPVKSGTSILYK